MEEGWLSAQASPRVGNQVLWERVAPINPTTTLWAGARPGPQTRAQLACVLALRRQDQEPRGGSWERDCLSRLAGQRRDLWVTRLSHPQCPTCPEQAPPSWALDPLTSPLPNSFRRLQLWLSVPLPGRHPSSQDTSPTGRHPEPPPTDYPPSTQKEWSWRHGTLPPVPPPPRACPTQEGHPHLLPPSQAERWGRGPALGHSKPDRPGPGLSVCSPARADGPWSGGNFRPWSML